jgi:hypothetical protein
MFIRFNSLSLSAVLCTTLCATAGAQTPAKPAKPATSQAKPPSIVIPSAPAAKPQAATRTLGGKGSGGKMLSRDELRACLKRLDDVNAGGKDLEQRRAAMDRDKDELSKGGEALKTERADIDVKLAGVREWEGRMRNHAAEIETFNQRLKAAEEMSRAQREAQQPLLEAERERLNAARAVLAQDEGRLVPVYQGAVKAYNERALARDAQVATWNDRNKALNEAAIKQEEDRTGWLADCANRPYREDDEIAIKAGK